MTICSCEETINEFEMLTRDAARVQKDTLKKILEINASAEYLQNFGLGGRTDAESYKSCIPLCVHNDIEPYIQRIVDGDTSPVVTGEPITNLSLSSGTTHGKPKFIPFNDELLETTLQIYRTSYAFRNREYPIGQGKALQFVYGSKQVITKGGILATTATTNLYRRQRYKEGMKDIQSQCCSPDEVIFGPDFHQSLYCHLLCGLIYSEEVHSVFSTFAHSLVHAFQTFEEVWEDLCTDIRDGVLSKKVTAPSIREAVSKILKPNPELADSIYKKCIGLSNWYGVIPALWPNAKYVYGIMTGSMEPYLKKLRHYAGNLPLISADYGASEGWVGSNIDPTVPPEQVTYAVLPQVGYFEFIPLEKPIGEETENSASIHYIESDPVGLTEVEVGKIYEVVITNFAGLYRYRLGDVVKIARFHNSTPELQFICRRSLVLSINIDKNTEKDLQLAVEEASKFLEGEKLEVMDFTSFVERSSDPGRYVIFWELSGDASDEVLSSCANALDLAFIDAGYTGSRKIKTIGPLELRILRKGTFKEILDHFLSLGGAVSQFKTPRFVNPSNSKVLQILSRNVTQSYFSTAYGF
ncbi:jasmonoyl--L-amino acid synthetase GH3.5 [Oryza sativa Japonica Group]|jgi:jasmonic acid-amino synthetase|uniref:Jasmonoyl--L-amino acid synthetase GH3.5 n=3 Tax=Oryza TaxID=4527 RepID=GH35_ORYSJ|nr:jasmonoyl--L-amino acid synthetase GH3.5 [Oryza sativa Japonica Group]NP_001407856.1 jasmonoyl--L-amino acid synthetase GH3.5 [Oryza sativa Japonica Group]Q6I581.1 RecName: Full=Jasmonoyl--L-amino acid synthetase GH3.5; AltName: Full=Auxin-responsive GH3-like protein 5; Short=OsGH3-5; AltName: Full=Indole-3-acetic acid-amido synthetase GH3.5; AltName: Full=Jasmonate-amino acid synthetase JAR1; AltName: Full=Jasmonic acid-amido synthetase JAR1; AltName: Full=Protein JASMONATE RESISTANT 1; Short|eukprot:NP_001056460.1 Os05g0586200 [Oryza sativa Japonica Group]